MSGCTHAHTNTEYNTAVVRGADPVRKLLYNKVGSGVTASPTTTTTTTTTTPPTPTPTTPTPTPTTPTTPTSP